MAKPYDAYLLPLEWRSTASYYVVPQQSQRSSLLMDTPAVCHDTVELVLVLGGRPDASDPVSKALLGSADYEAAVGSWLSHLQLNLQIGSRFHVQSGGR